MSPPAKMPEHFRGVGFVLRFTRRTWRRPLATYTSPMATRDGTFTIVQISDLHCGTQFFLPNLLERAITEVNDVEPDIVVISGDLTTFGFKEEYALAKEYIDTIACEAFVVLPGHKHVPYAWRLEDLFIVNAGTVSSLRLRGNTRPCYNVIEFSGTHVDVWRRYPFHGQEKIIQFAIDTLEFEKYTARIEGEVTSRR